jgi:hypothetical protein
MPTVIDTVILDLPNQIRNFTNPMLSGRAWMYRVFMQVSIHICISNVGVCALSVRLPLEGM